MYKYAPYKTFSLLYASPLLSPAVIEVHLLHRTSRVPHPGSGHGHLLPLFPILPIPVAHPSEGAPKPWVAATYQQKITHYSQHAPSSVPHPR